MNNPYRVGEPVFDDGEFFDRTAEISAIQYEARVDGHLSVLVRGPRRIGKTSVLMRAKTLLARAGHPTALVELREIESEHPRPGTGELTRAVLAKIVARMDAPEGGRVPLDKPMHYDSVSGFRERILPQLNQLYPQKRAIVLIDEMEVLASYDERAPSQVLSALNPGSMTRGVRRPLTVIAEGRTWAQSSNDSPLLSQLRTTPSIQLALFGRDILRQMIVEPTQHVYAFTEAAVDEVCRWSAGYPFLAAALAYAIFEERAGNTTVITPEDVRSAVERALDEAEPGLVWARNQIPPEQQMLLFGIADLAQRTGLPERFMTIPEIADSVSEHFHLKADLAGSLLQPLIENCVVEKREDGEAFRIRAPLYRSWLRKDSFADIRARALTSDRQAQDLYTEAQRLIASDELWRARELLMEAFSLNPHHWKAALETAEVDARLGDRESAIVRVRGLAREHPGGLEVERLLGDLLSAHAASLLNTGDHWGAEQALAEIEGFDPTLRRFPKADRIRLQLKVGYWRQRLRDDPPSTWRSATEELAGEIAGSAWWWYVVAVYCGSLRKARPSDESEKLALALACEVFPLLVKRAPDPTDAAEGITDEAQAALSREAFGSFDLQTAWKLTIELLESTLSREFDPAQHRVPARLFEELLSLRIAEDQERTLQSLADRYLPSRLSATIQDDPDDVIALARMLARSAERLALLRNSVERSAVEASEDPDAAAQFLRLAPKLYPILLQADRRLPRDARVRQMEEYAGQLEVVLDALPGVGSVAEILHETEQAEWRRLLSMLAGTSPDRIERLDASVGGALANEPTVPDPPLIPDHQRNPDREFVQKVLGTAYRIGESIPYAIDNVPSGTLAQYEATHTVDGGAKPERVLVRVYSIRGRNSATRNLIHWLWSNEYRALFSLSTRWEGRSLLHLKFAHFDPQSQNYILASEHVGFRSLRHELDEGRIAAFSETDRGDLWRHLYALTEAVAGLHDLGYMHRSIRPENILVDGNSRSKARFRLTNFEWSVAVNSLANLHAIGARRRDYYLSPEALRSHANSSAVSAGGEGFGVDAYGLGLVFFECLIRRLQPEELFVLESVHEYPERHHAEWLEGLRAEIRQSLAGGNLIPEEARVLRGLLNPDPHRRDSDLVRVAQRVRRLAMLRSDLAARLRTRPLIAFTPLRLELDSCVKNFLQEQIVLPVEVGNDPDLLARFVEHELRDAKVFLSNSEERPLLLKGKRIAFTAKPFEYDGTEYRKLAYLEVAKKGIQADGDWIARLGAVVIEGVRDGLKVHEIMARGAWWDELFSLAEERLDGLQRDERRFLRTMAVTLELEARVWNQSIQRCEIIASGTSGDAREQFVLLRGAEENPDNRGVEQSGSRSKRLSLIETVEQNVDRQVNEFDLARSADSTTAFYRELRWRFVGVEMDETGNGEPRVRLARPIRKQTPEPPPAGQIRFLRPWSLAASRVVYQRHREVIRGLQTDSFLLRSMVSPGSDDHILATGALDFFDKDLDPNKQELVTDIVRRRPLFVVQGPPGTGKTTLAREVVLQLLAADPGTRILITSQGHEPLNNLLDKTEVAITEEIRRREPRLRKPLSVRLLAADKQYGDMGTRIDARFLPAEVAKEILARAAEWRPRPGEVEESEIVHDWLQFLSEQTELGVSTALEKRLVRSANLVYATANDKHLLEFKPGSFDLVIFEEAARAYPIELLGPMRLARRWLLIGDHAQLPPFGIEEYRHQLNEYVEAAGKPGTNLDGVPSFLGYTDAKELKEALEDNTALFQKLFRFGEHLPRPISRPLQYQWRMHPAIGAMVSRTFYHGLLKTAEPEVLARQRRHRLRAPPGLEGKALIWLDVPSMIDDALAADEPAPGGGFQNAYEIRALQGFFREMVGPRLETAVLSPYRGQVRLMQHRFFDTWQHPVTGPLAERIFTVDSFQGRQAALIAVSLVRNNANPRITSAIGFVDNESRATVMFSRAEKLLVVIGSSHHFARFRKGGRPNYVSEIYDYACRHGEVLQAFDFLRRDDREAMSAFQRRVR